MERIAGDTVAQDLFGSGKHGFQPGSPSQQIPATIVTAAFLNAIQEELARAVEGAGLVLDPNNRGQLAQVLAPLLPADRVDYIDPAEGFSSVSVGTNPPIYNQWFVANVNASASERGVLSCYADNAIFSLPLRLPTGGRLRQVRVVVARRNGENGTAAQNASITLQRVTREPFVEFMPPIPAFAEVSGAGAVLRTSHAYSNVLTTGIIDEALDGTAHYRLLIASAQNIGGASTPDRLLWVEVSRTAAPALR